MDDLIDVRFGRVCNGPEGRSGRHRRGTATAFVGGGSTAATTAFGEDRRGRSFGNGSGNGRVVVVGV